MYFNSSPILTGTELSILTLTILIVCSYTYYYSNVEVLIYLIN